MELTAQITSQQQLEAAFEYQQKSPKKLLLILHVVATGEVSATPALPALLVSSVLFWISVSGQMFE